MSRTLFLAHFFVYAIAYSDPLIRITDTWRYSKGSEVGANNDQAHWQSPEFDDSDWQQAKGGFVGGLTTLEQATRFFDFGLGYHSMFFRKEFEVADPEAIQRLVLRFQFKHGIIFWLNGQPFLQAGFGGKLAHEVLPNDLAEWGTDNLVEERIVDQAIPLLRKGKNTLAAQVHASMESTSLTFLAELSSNFSRAPMVHHLTSDSALISWKTQIPSKGRVSYGLVNDYLNQSVAFEASTPDPEITLKHLQSGCTYHYRVELETTSGLITSKRLSFTTPDGSDKRLRFAVLGDSGRGTIMQYRIADQIGRRQPSLVLHTGDTVYPFLTSDLVDLRYYSVYGAHMDSIPYYVATGNHDVDTGLSLPTSLFHRPENDTPAALHEEESTYSDSYYTVRHGPAQFFILFAPFFYQYVLTPESAQYAWLQKELSQSDSTWKFLVMHHPIRTSSLHRFDDYNRNTVLDTTELREVILPLAKRFGVQMVFSGHDHVYERFQPDSGVVSVTTAGGGGSLYSLRERDESSSHFRVLHHFMSVEIEGDICRMEAVDDAGNVIDTFTLSQGSDRDQSFDSMWYSPNIESGPSNDGDGNIEGQQFDFLGTSMVANLGQYSHAGELKIHNDAEYLYLGIRSVALPNDGALMLFLGINSEEVDYDPTEIAFLNQLKFDGWSPHIVAVLGDELADDTSQAFNRSGMGLLGPQGVFYAGDTLKPVLGTRIQQYNLSPQIPTASLSNTHFSEQNADIIEVAIPLSSIPGLAPGGSFELAVITGRQPTLAAGQDWSFDESMMGGEVAGGEFVLGGLRVKTKSGPDSDDDGLADPEEHFWQTDVNDSDSDDDGLPDGWEVFHHFSPVDGELSEGHAGDPDGDGLSNLDEWLAKTHPRDESSNLLLQATLVEREIIQLKWKGMPGVSYVIQSSQILEGPFFPLEPTVPYDQLGSVSKIIKHHLRTSTGEAKFFRLVATPEPLR